MPNRLRCAISAVIFSLCLVACKEQTAEIGKAAPDFATFDLQGNKVELSQWEGKKLLVSFWSETCGICIAELTELDKMAQTYPEQVQVIAINIDGEYANTQAIIEKRKIHLPVLKDQLKMTGERYGVIGTPTSFVIDQQGNIQAKFEGLIPKDELQKIFNG